MFAPRVISTSARASFFQLPAHLRSQAYQHGLRRSFSISRPLRVETTFVGDSFAAGPLCILTALHSVGLPWYAVIPAAALVVRGAAGYFFADRPAHQAAATHEHLRPIVQALMLANRANDKARKIETKTTKDLDDSAGIRGYLKTLLMYYVVSRRVAISFDTYIFSPVRVIFNFVGLISTTEAIRLKSGASTGLLNFLGSFLDPYLSRTGPASDLKAVADRETVPVSGSVAPLPERAEGILPELQRKGDAVDATLGHEALQAPSEPLKRDILLSFDPSIQVEGLSWCPDLSVHDPTYILPTTLFCLACANIFLRPRESIPKSWAGRLSSLTRPQVLGAAVAFLLFQFRAELPAGIYLYLISSLVIGRGLRIWLNVRHPIAPTVKMCSRPRRKNSTDVEDI